MPGCHHCLQWLSCQLPDLVQETHTGNQCVQPMLVCGLGAGDLWNLLVLFFFSTFSNQKSFGTSNSFTKRQFLTHKLNQVSKIFLAREFAAYYIESSSIGGIFKGLRSVWALAGQSCSQAACPPCPLKVENLVGNSCYLVELIIN